MGLGKIGREWRGEIGEWQGHIKMIQEGHEENVHTGVYWTNIRRAYLSTYAFNRGFEQNRSLSLRVASMDVV